MRVYFAVIAATLLSVCMVTTSDADTITFTLDNASQDISSSGGSDTFNATVVAPATNTASIFLNGVNFNAPPPPVTLDDSDFFANFPFFLTPGSSFTGDLFVLTAPPGISPNVYLGTFTLLGGRDGGAANFLGTVNFSLDVSAPEPVSVPEPSSLALLGGGLLWLMMAMRRRLST